MSDSRYTERQAHPGRFRCCGVLIDGLAPEAATQALLRSRNGTARRIHLCDVYTLTLALRDTEFRDLLNQAHVNLPCDNRLVKLGHRLGNGNITGPVKAESLMIDTLSQGRQVGLRHFLYGADQGIVDSVYKNIEAKLPGVDIVGTGAFDGHLIPIEVKELTKQVRDTAPDVVWVGLDTPLRDGFVAEYAERFGATVVPVGRVFEALAGKRMTSVPASLWRRHLLGNAVFYYGNATDARRSRRLDHLTKR